MWSVTFPSAPADGMKGAETPTMQEHLSGEMSVIRAQHQERLQAKSLHRHKDTDTNSEEGGPRAETMRGTGDLLYPAERWQHTHVIKHANYILIFYRNICDLKAAFLPSILPFHCIEF